MIDPQTMRDTLRFWASGVAVVTTADSKRRAGMTVSAFNSLSLEPPLVLVCLYKDTTTAEHISEIGYFAISILGEDHAYLSDRFAGRIPLLENEDRFDGVAITSATTGSPILREALAWLDCRVHQVHDGSTHWIVCGEVLAAGRGSSEAPLIYYDRNYRNLMLETEHT
jgi:flavin reductase (DIM6/NTAB) family NADH-FMN oxidoreductase RutF